MARKKLKYRNRRKIVPYDEFPVEGFILLPVSLEETPYEAYILIKRRGEKLSSRKVYASSRIQHLTEDSDRLKKIEDAIGEIKSYLGLNPNNTKVDDMYRDGTLVEDAKPLNPNNTKVDDSPEEGPKETIWQHIDKKIDEKMEKYKVKIKEEFQNALADFEERLYEKFGPVFEKINSISERLEKLEKEMSVNSERLEKLEKEMKTSSVQLTTTSEAKQLSPQPQPSEEDLEKIVSKYEISVLKSIEIFRTENIVSYDAFKEDSKIYNKIYLAVRGDHYHKKIDIEKLLEYEREKKKDPIIYLPIIQAAHFYGIKLTEDERKALEELFKIHEEWVIKDLIHNGLKIY